MGVWDRFRETKVYDVLVAAPFAAFCLYMTKEHLRNVTIGITAIAINQPIGIRGWAMVATSASLALFVWLQAILFVTRIVPKKRAGGVFSRLVAASSTMLSFSLLLLPRAEISPSTAAIATGTTFAGSIFAFYSLWWLGRSFSIMPEARTLVTGGPYSLIRHPLYLAEFTAIVGASMAFQQPFALLIVATLAVLLLCRMGFEESVLAAAFPEYSSYASRTARVIPFIY